MFVYYYNDTLCQLRFELYDPCCNPPFPLQARGRSPSRCRLARFPSPAKAGEGGCRPGEWCGKTQRRANGDAGIEIVGKAELTHATAMWPARRAFEISSDLHGANFRNAAHCARRERRAHKAPFVQRGGTQFTLQFH